MLVDEIVEKGEREERNDSGDEVSGPAVHDLVGEHIDERLVAGLLEIYVFTE